MQGDDECSGFILVYEEFIEYSTYRVYLSLPDTDNNYFVGDVNFQVLYYIDLFLLSSTGTVMMALAAWRLLFE